MSEFGDSPLPARVLFCRFRGVKADFEQAAPINPIYEYTA